jgi:hypothetical protein
MRRPETLLHSSRELEGSKMFRKSSIVRASELDMVNSEERDIELEKDRLLFTLMKTPNFSKLSEISLELKLLMLTD